MKCPHCKKSGNIFKRVFVKRSYGENHYCMYCNAEVKLEYKTKKILLLAVATLFGLVLTQLLLQFIGLPGMNSGVAGGIAGGTIAIFIQKHPFLEITLLNTPDNYRK
jgi:hypothetical protein